MTFRLISVYHSHLCLEAAVYLAATLEYLSAEVLEAAGEAAHENRKRRIEPRHIMLAIRKDQELNAMMRNVTISSSGTVPHIHEELLIHKNK